MAEAWSENQRSRAVLKLALVRGVAWARREGAEINPSSTHAKTALKKAEEPGELLFFMGTVGRWAKTVLIL